MTNSAYLPPDIFADTAAVVPSFADGYFYKKYFNSYNCAGTVTFTEGYSTGVCFQTSSRQSVILEGSGIVNHLPYSIYVIFTFRLNAHMSNYCLTAMGVRSSVYNSTICDISKMASSMVYPMGSCSVSPNQRYGLSFLSNWTSTISQLPVAANANMVVERYPPTIYFLYCKLI